MSVFLKDAVGTFHRPAPEARILSLVPSLTELLFDLGLGDQVVGRTAFCVHPTGRVRSATSVGGTKSVNFAKVRALGASHVLVNIDETPRGLAQQLAREGLIVVVTHPIEVRDNLSLYRLIGGLFGRPDEAETLCGRFEAALEALNRIAADQPEWRVLYLIWKDPWMTVSRETYISRMLALARLMTLPDCSEPRYPSVVLDAATLAAVDLVLFSSEPFPFKVQHLQAFRDAHPSHAGKPRLVDGEMVSWYGSRSIAGLGYLKDVLSDRAGAWNH